MIQQKWKELKEKYKKVCNTLRVIKKIVPTKEALKDLLHYKHHAMQQIEQLQFELNDTCLMQRKGPVSPHRSTLTIEEESALRAELEKARFSQIEKEKLVAELKATNETLSIELNCLKKKHDSIMMELDKGEILKAQILEKEKMFTESKMGQELINRARKSEATAVEYQTLAYAYKKALNEELKKEGELRQELQLYKTGGKYKDAEQKLIELRNITNGLTERLGAKEVEISSIKDVNRMLMQKIEDLKKSIANGKLTNQSQVYIIILAHNIDFGYQTFFYPLYSRLSISCIDIIYQLCLLLFDFETELC
eukprot:TRINITY_DN121032_c0_g1_i1.p2 TRINITY_DN121032_c0_g1~~TRINITY_DN121032_c0_g1_i1.p2  ORF type:complete len:309 (-),score=48.84 TRINITY_DN121032_c0_g1_i1:1525-2451(-)